MKQFRTLFFYEIKKVLQQKSIWICLAAVFLVCLLTELLQWGQVFTTVTTSSSAREGAVMEDDRYSETYADQVKMERDNARKLAGRKLDDTILSEWKEYENNLAYSLREMNQGETLAAFRKYNLLKESIANLLEEDIGKVSLDMDRFTEDTLYSERDALLMEKWGEKHLTEGEKKYWKNKESSLKKPFTLQNFSFFENVTGNNGIELIFILVSFLIAFMAGKIFSVEHNCKTDQIILCSRYGRKEIYYAKILTGMFLSVCMYLFFTAVMILIKGVLYGFDGADAMIQLLVGGYSLPMTLGQTMWVMLIIGLFASVLMSLLAMILGEKFRRESVSLAIIIAVLFLAKIIHIPDPYRLISQIWNYIPVNLLDLRKGFCDVRLVTIGGMKLTSWQFGVIVYAIMSIAFIAFGKNCYSKYQVK